MAKKRLKNKDNARRSKKKISVLAQERVEYVDWKDVDLLRRFMSDRAKIRARRVTGNDSQQQREVARAIKNAREFMRQGKRSEAPAEVRPGEQAGVDAMGSPDDAGDRPRCQPPSVERLRELLAGERGPEPVERHDMRPCREPRGDPLRFLGHADLTHLDLLELQLA